MGMERLRSLTRPFKSGRMFLILASFLCAFLSRCWLMLFMVTEKESWDNSRCTILTGCMWGCWDVLWRSKTEAGSSPQEPWMPNQQAKDPLCISHHFTTNLYLWRYTQRICATYIHKKPHSSTQFSLYLTLLGFYIICLPVAMISFKEPISSNLSAIIFPSHLTGAPVHHRLECIKTIKRKGKP